MNKTMMLAWLGCSLAVASEEAVERLFSVKLNETQRNEACARLHGESSPAVLEAMMRALDDDTLRACAVSNLRAAGAGDRLAAALQSENPQVRAAAARELGALQKPEFLDALSRAAEDPNLLVSSNAMQGLSNYTDSAVIPRFAALAAKGGMTGDMALDQLLTRDPQAALPVARALLASSQVSDRLYAMRVIGAAGNASDLPALERIATGSKENLSSRGRGFGLMPAINLSRAAETAISEIRSRP